MILPGIIISINSFGTASGQTPKYYFTDADIEYYKTHSTDWQDEIYNTGVMQNANLAISGATDRLKYMVSTGLPRSSGDSVKLRLQQAFIEGKPCS